MKIFFDNTSSVEVKRTVRNCDFYLEKIKELNIGRQFESLRAICTDGEIRPMMKYQWIATSTRLVGDDDPFEATGKTPFEAIKNLYAEMKFAIDNYREEDEF